MTTKLLLKLFEPCEIRAFRGNLYTTEELARIVSLAKKKNKNNINIEKLEAALERNSFEKDGDKWVCRTVNLAPRFAR
jgi:hypothetical protein